MAICRASLHQYAIISDDRHTIRDWRHRCRAGRQRRRPLRRSISRHSGHPFTSPSTTPPPSAATRPECAAQPSYAVVTNRSIPPIRNNRPRSCATTPGVSRQIRPDAHHGSTQDPWPKHPSTTPADLRPTAPTRPPSCRLSAPIRQKSHPRPVKRDFRGTEHMPPPTSNRETRRYIYNRALKTHRVKFTKNGLYLRVLRAWFPCEIHRVLSRTITLQSVINNSGLAISPRMRPRIRSTAVGAVHSRRESMVVSGICRYCDSSMLSNPIT